MNDREQDQQADAAFRRIMLSKRRNSAGQWKSPGMASGRPESGFPCSCDTYQQKRGCGLPCPRARAARGRQADEHRVEVEARFGVTFFPPPEW